MRFARLDTIHGAKHARILEILDDLEQESGLNMDNTVPLLGLWDNEHHLVGAIWIEDTKEGGYWNVAVFEKYQNKGYGKKLIAELHKLAKKLHYEFLQCDPENPMVGDQIVNVYHYQPYGNDWRLTF